jgi:ubiquinone/menaquinone biosynthesis C-methylase UbiE
MTAIPEEIQAHYLEGLEADRLRSDAGELEFLRTQAILARGLRPPPATVLDIGGGAGAYAIPLAAQGYDVHLIDPVPLHLDQARVAAARAGVRLGSLVLGDARSLEREDQSADAILLLGPLYHLTERSDRVRALGESFRVLKSGGIVFAAGISRFASLIDGMSKGFFADPDFREIVKEDLSSGQHRNPTGNPRYFTTAFFHRPEELAADAREAAFREVELVAVEGPVWSAGRFEESWRDPTQRSALMHFLSAVDREPSILGASAHVLLVARRPG